MSLLKAMRRETGQLSKAELHEREAELAYWESALSEKLGQSGLTMSEFQRDHDLVPPLEQIRTIQSESKAEPNLFLSSGMQAAVYYLEELERAGARVQDFNRILEFGVGFGRILRHFSPYQAELFGCDVTPNVIDWCNENLSHIGSFQVTEFDPPLPFPDGHFDFIYANSVFTHLQHQQTLSWIAELRRVVRNDGFVITTHYDINEHLRTVPASKLHQAWHQTGAFEWGNSTVRENNICYSPEKLQAVWGEHFEVVEKRQYLLEQSHLVCRAS